VINLRFVQEKMLRSSKLKETKFYIASLDINILKLDRFFL